LHHQWLLLLVQLRLAASGWATSMPVQLVVVVVETAAGQWGGIGRVQAREDAHYFGAE